MKGIRPLMIAAKVSSKKIVKLLLCNGADINKLDRNGLPALGFALKAGTEISRKC